MQTVQVILIFVVLFGAVALMMTKKLPAILALPLIGILYRRRALHDPR